MKNLIIFSMLVFSSACTLRSQDTARWDAWKWIIGEWRGEGSGTPGQGGGIFSFSPDLQNTILVRKSHSEYPAAGNKPAVVHEDLMIVYADSSGTISRAIYFDNEGHIINYEITLTEKSIIFTSEKKPRMPVFRLSYSLLNDGMVNTKFEMSRDGVTFSPYIEGKSRKIK